MTHRNGLLAIGSLALLCAVGSAEAQVKCVPNPTLKCVLDLAERLVDEAGTLADFHDLAIIARAQKKLGAKNALQRTIAIARRRAAALLASSDEHQHSFHKLRFAEFILAVGESDPVLATFDAEIADAKAYWTDPSIRLVGRYVDNLVKAGKRSEALAAIAEQHAWLQAAGPSVFTRTPNEGRDAYGQDLLRAMVLSGQNEKARELGAAIWAQLLREAPVKAPDAGGFEGEDAVAARLQLARLLIDAGKPTPTAEIVSNARTLLGPLPRSPSLSQTDHRRLTMHTLLHELELPLSRMKKDAALEQSTIRRMQDLRAVLPAEKRAWQLWKDTILFIEAGIKPIPRQVGDQAANLLGTANSNSDLAPLGQIYAMLGDVARVRGVLARLRQDEGAEFTAESVRDICVHFARYSHLEAALECANRLTGSEDWQRANRVSLIANIVRTLAR